MVALVSARKIPDAVCRREGPCGPPPSEGGYPHEVWVQPPPYPHPGNGIFIRCGETRFMTTWWWEFRRQAERGSRPYFLIL